MKYYFIYYAHKFHISYIIQLSFTKFSHCGILIKIV
nr:MAG TPA: hypothetical protein [Caudoviricetes sp.]